MNFLAELGGFMGMIIGASWISVGELLAFYFAFWVIIFKFLCSKFYCKSQNVMNSQAPNPTKNYNYE